MAKKNKNQNSDLNNENQKPVLEIITEEEVLEEQKENETVELSLEDIKEEIKNEMKEEEHKNENKIKIIDVSKKREQNKKQELYYKLEGFTSNLGFSDSEELAEKVFDSLIFIGGGFLASTTLATRTISSLAEKIIK